VLFAAEDFFRWQPHPEVWVLVLGLAGLWLYAMRAIGPKVVPAGEPVATRSQKRWFALGIVLLWFAADWPMHDIGEEYLYSVHMFQHMLLAFFIPPVMLLATPEWLARLVIGDGTIGRWFLKLARPVPGAVIFNAVQLLTHWSVVVNGSVENGLLHYGLHTIVVITAFAVWMPVVSPMPELRITIPAQCIHLFLMSIVPTVPAAWLALADGVLYDAYDIQARLWGVGVTTDQQMAGLIMKLGGSMFLWTLIVVLFFRWNRTQDHGTTARRVVLDDDGRIVRVEGPAALTYDEVAKAFEASGPAPREPAP
jgi:putative membrane protein